MGEADASFEITATTTTFFSKLPNVLYSSFSRIAFFFNFQDGDMMTW